MENQAMSKLDRNQTAELSKGPEQTRPGPVYTPAADIFESEDVITLLADLPGVAPADLTIDLRDSVLTLTGRARSAGEGKESPLLREFAAGTFYRQFTLSDTIDQSKIDAKIVDGVLRLELPKAERAKPRRISVKSA
jgi:HSP20 family molecular chaperone IbpA